jgi:glycosyltransferase involved in cell wall biosynthesis
MPRAIDQDRPMKIVMVHNTYQQPGGEDVVFQQECANLARAGHEVVRYERSNFEIEKLSAAGRLALPKNTIWSAPTRRDFADLLQRERPDLVHVHNTFVMISPSIYAACRDHAVPVVQTLHNFRLLCPAATLYRDGNICEDCLTGSLWNSVRHSCYRDSKSASATVALMLASHRRLGTWQDSIDRYIALTEFSRDKFISAGFPAHKIAVKPNFVGSDPGPRTETPDQKNNFALFAGRLTPEKGLSTLLDAWERLAVRCPLQIVGDGPERAALESRVRDRNIQGVTFRGSLPRAETLALMKTARFLIAPSTWYEGFPMVIAEALACGTPVICSRLGALREIIADGITGLHFTPGDAQDLSRKVAQALNQPDALAAMSRNARHEYEQLYTAEKNYQLQMEIYRQAIGKGSSSTNSCLPRRSNAEAGAPTTSMSQAANA